jgi:hypothetical protein
MSALPLPECPTVDLKTVLAPYTATRAVTRQGEPTRLAKAIDVAGKRVDHRDDAQVQGVAVDSLFLLVTRGVRDCLRYLQVSTDSCYLPTQDFARSVLTAFATTTEED